MVQNLIGKVASILVRSYSTVLGFLFRQLRKLKPENPRLRKVLLNVCTTLWSQTIYSNAYLSRIKRGKRI